MPEVGVKSNKVEAERLYQRGVAATRGGQRRVAAVLLGRAVQLNPHHELAWLWLSGVLDDPNEIAFCLRSVLSINPHNERARQGLKWLEERKQIPAQTSAPATVAPAEPEEEEHEEIRKARHEGEAWWVNWRRAKRDMSRAWLVIWSLPVILLTLTLLGRFALVNIVENNQSIAHANAQTQVQAEPEPIEEDKPTPILQAQLSFDEDAQALAYLNALEAPRAKLREAVEHYRAATSQPGGSSTVHAAAARRFREEIVAMNELLGKLSPSNALAQSHADYLAGLELEQAAMSDMLEFYSSFSISLANRATLRLEDAGKRFERARSAFDKHYAEAIKVPLPSHTIR